MAKVASSPEDVELRIRSGTVAGSSIWSETEVNVRTSAPTSDGFGNVLPGSTTSSVTSHEKNRFFLVEADGSERAITTWNTGFAARDGHSAKAVYGRVGGGDEALGTLIGLRNETTGQTLVVKDNIRSLSRSLNKTALFLVLIALFLVVWLVSSISLALLALVAGTGYVVWRRIGARRIDAAVTARVKEAIGAG